MCASLTTKALGRSELDSLLSKSQMRSNRPSPCDAESRHLLRRLPVLASERLRSVRSPCPQYLQILACSDWQKPCSIVF